MELASDKTIWKKNLVNLKAEQQKLCKMKYKRKKELLKNEKSIHELGGNFKQTNIGVVGIPKKREGKTEKISEENKGSEISKLDENSKPLIQGTQQTPNTRSINKITPRNIIIEQLKPL